jgi:hypothetical protein
MYPPAYRSSGAPQLCSASWKSVFTGLPQRPLHTPGCTHTVLKSIDNMFGGPPQPLPPAAHFTTMSLVFLDMQVIGVVPSGALKLAPIVISALDTPDSDRPNLA